MSDEEAMRPINPIKTPTYITPKNENDRARIVSSEGLFKNIKEKKRRITAEGKVKISISGWIGDTEMEAVNAAQSVAVTKDNRRKGDGSENEASSYPERADIADMPIIKIGVEAKKTKARTSGIKKRAERMRLVKFDIIKSDRNGDFGF